MDAPGDGQGVVSSYPTVYRTTLPDRAANDRRLMEVNNFTGPYVWPHPSFRCECRHAHVMRNEIAWQEDLPFLLSSELPGRGFRARAATP